MGTALDYIAAILSAIATLIGAIVGIGVYRAKRAGDVVTSSLASLKAALERSDQERARLESIVGTIRKDFEARLIEAEEHCNKELALLTARIAELGG